MMFLYDSLNYLIMIQEIIEFYQLFISWWYLEFMRDIYFLLCSLIVVWNDSLKIKDNINTLINIFQSRKIENLIMICSNNENIKKYHLWLRELPVQIADAGVEYTTRKYGRCRISTNHRGWHRHATSISIRNPEWQSEDTNDEHVVPLTNLCWNLHRDISRLWLTKFELCMRDKWVKLKE